MPLLLILIKLYSEGMANSFWLHGEAIGAHDIFNINLLQNFHGNLLSEGMWFPSCKSLTLDHWFQAEVVAKLLRSLKLKLKLHNYDIMFM